VFISNVPIANDDGEDFPAFIAGEVHDTEDKWHWPGSRFLLSTNTPPWMTMYKPTDEDIIAQVQDKKEVELAEQEQPDNPPIPSVAEATEFRWLKTQDIEPLRVI